MQVKIQINLIWNSKTERSNIYIRVLISLFAAEYNYIFIIFTNEFYVLTGIGEVLILFSLSILIVSKHLGRNSSGRHTLRMSYAFSSCFSHPLLHFMCQMAHGIENIVRIRIWIAFGIRIRFRIFHLHSMAISAFFASGLWPHKTEKMREGWGRWGGGEGGAFCAGGALICKVGELVWHLLVGLVAKDCMVIITIKF